MAKLKRPYRILIIILGIILMVLVLSILGQWIFDRTYRFPAQINYGVTFSPQFAQDLGLDWQDTYLKTLDEVKVKRLRLPTYWNVLEKEPDSLDYSEIDWMLSEAQKRGAQVILVVGVRQPRWPECHIPSWARQLSVKERQQQILELINQVVSRYQNHPSIVAYQVENEPLFRFFGEGCDDPDVNFLTSEVELVRELTDKPIIVTASGELELWGTHMRLSDIFGTTLYRKVYNPITHFTSYPIFPYMYNLKSSLTSSIFAPQNQKTIIAELQAEPWSPVNDLMNMPLTQQMSVFSLDKFQENINYAKKTGFDSAYLWGVEWWYWMREAGHPQYLDYAKTLF
ncbi:cellulase family glycosylhydrolase [Candidatus Daviesbacteria bacterium]|nr:cellulase family glycosylhydrolase [Candidatus Daviesbacteria bacterium]